MTTQTSDPITQIQKAEQETEEKVQQAAKEFDEKLKKHKEELTKKTEEFEKNLREKGTERLTNVKTEAGEIYKTRMATNESEKNKVLSDAKGKKKEGVDEVISIFLNQIKA